MKARAKNSLLLLALTAGFELAPADDAWADGDALHVLGYVRDHQGNPVVGVDVIGDNYVGGSETSITDAGGFYEIEVEPEVNLRVQVDCEQLAARGFSCAPPVGVTASADDIQLDFIVYPALTNKPMPVLSSPVWKTNRFSMMLTGTVNQNYTIQVCTNLSSRAWTTLFVTNHSTASTYLVVDPQANSRERFYRVLVGP